MKRKDSLDARAVLSINFWVDRTGNILKQQKMTAFTVSVRNFLVKMTLMLF